MFDPTLPQAGTPIDAVEMRSQLNGLKDLIDAVPAVADAVVDGVTTLTPAEPAQATASFDGSRVHFTFAIPRGIDGASAAPITTFIVDAVNILPPEDPPSANATFDGGAVHLVFNLPRGLTGNDGIQGPPGEVTNAALTAALTAAINGTSSNSNAVDLIPFTANGTYDVYQQEAIINKINELINALRR
ncbi:MAG: hypothetical protein U1F71_00725 [Verrucomicrobiaceae bacterium]